MNIKFAVFPPLLSYLILPGFYEHKTKICTSFAEERASLVLMFV